MAASDVPEFTSIKAFACDCTGFVLHPFDLAASSPAEPCSTAYTILEASFLSPVFFSLLPQPDKHNVAHIATESNKAILFFIYSGF